MSHRARYFLSLAAVVCLIGGTCSPAQAQAPAPSLAFRHGTHALRGILKDLGLQALPGADSLAERPDRTLLIVLGETDILDRVGLQQFLQKGGAVLVATDRENPGAWQNYLGVRIESLFLKIPTDHDRSYQGLEDCPCVNATGQEPQLFQGLDRVATNKPKYLTMERGSLRVIGRFPGACYVPLGRLELRGPTAFAAAGTLENGRVLVLSDHSVFINDMMLREDTDNIDFAYGCINWLTDYGRRDRVLFVEEGAIQGSFDVPLRDLPMPPLPSVEELVPWMNQVLVELEREDVFNRTLLAVLPRETLLRVLALLSALALVLYGVVRLMRARARIDPHAPLLSAGRPSPAAGLVEQRQQAMIHDRNLYEAARDLARHAFVSMGCRPDERAREAPPIQVGGGWWRRWTLSAEVARLWQLAHAPEPRPVSPAEFELLLKRLDRLKTAWQQGSLRVAPDSSPKREQGDR